MSLYESLVQGLNEAIEHAQGSRKLQTKRVSIVKVTTYNSESVKNIRIKAGMSQTAFASAMGVSKKAVEAWEAGTNTPGGAASRLLSLAAKDPHFFETSGIVQTSASNSHYTSASKSIQTVVYSYDPSEPINALSYYLEA